MKTTPLLHRLKVAYKKLHQLAPDIYNEAHVAAQIRAAGRRTERELEYFVLQMESTVHRKQKKQK